MVLQRLFADHPLGQRRAFQNLVLGFVKFSVVVVSYRIAARSWTFRFWGALRSIRTVASAV